MTILKMAMAAALLGLGSMPATAQTAGDSMNNGAPSTKQMSTHKVTTTTHTMMHKSMSHHPMMMKHHTVHHAMTHPK